MLLISAVGPLTGEPVLQGLPLPWGGRSQTPPSTWSPAFLEMGVLGAGDLAGPGALEDPGEPTKRRGVQVRHKEEFPREDRLDAKSRGWFGVRKAGCGAGGQGGRKGASSRI